MEKEIEIKFDYEYDCGGYVYSKSIQMLQEDFNNDKLLVLVCAYIQTECGYPGPEIDEYLHNRFPDVHTLEDMLCGGIYNIYDCHIDGLKKFSEVADGLLSMTYLEAEDYIKKECFAFNKTKKGERRDNFSIWNE